MWRVHNSSVSQILHEIKIGKSRVSKSVILTHSDDLNFDLYEFLRTFRGLKCTIVSKCYSINDKNGSSRFYEIDLT